MTTMLFSLTQKRAAIQEIRQNIDYIIYDPEIVFSCTSFAEDTGFDVLRQE